ncbi:MAG: lipoprotein-releasing ABC transporter permease subunit [Proteobacteria bacterium]|nr:lipoprotein-releasing ABC transporter permease subunit [Pseudomonadota bacterium]
MRGPIWLAIGLRYTRAKRRTGFLSFISAASILGIAIGVTALITTIAVMTGFQEEYRARMLSMVAHATIYGVGDGLSNWPGVVRAAREDPRVIGAAPFVTNEAMLQGNATQGAMLLGVDPAMEGQVDDVLAGKLVAGSLTDLHPGGFGVILGKDLANALAVGVGDKVNVLVAEGNVTPIGFVPRSKAFTVVGIFEAGFADYDQKLAVVDMADAQKLLRMGDVVTGVRLKLTDMWQAARVARDLSQRFGGAYSVRDWTHDNVNMFIALRTEKTMMFLILVLIVGVAAFNLLSSLVMVVTDKQADIAILRTLGMRPGAVMRVFMVQGSVIGALGVALGVAGGVALTKNLDAIVAVIERLTGIEVMPANVYYISGLPTRLEWSDVGTIAGVALVLCFIATLYPAWRAARIDPASALRYE